MKINIVIFFLLLNSSILFGQKYQPLLADSNKWYVNVTITYIESAAGEILNAERNVLFYTRGDTVINGLIYKKLFYHRSAYNIFDDKYFDTLYNFNYRQGFLREDTIAQKVYFQPVDSNSEFVLYDFSLNSGDSILLQFSPFPAADMPLKTDYHFVQNVSVDSANRKILVLKPKYKTNMSYNNTLTWVEGVGSLASPLYFYAPNDWGAIYVGNGEVLFHKTRLVCAFQNDRIVYGDSQKAVIYYIENHKTVNIETAGFESKNIFYSYNDNSIILNHTGNQPCNASIFNMQGQKVMSRIIPLGREQYKISGLPDTHGAYILFLQYNDRCCFFKYIKY